MFATGSGASNRSGLALALIAAAGALVAVACSSGSGSGTGTGGAGGSGGSGGDGGAITGGTGGQGGATGEGGAGACGAPVVDPEEVISGTPSWTAVAWAVFVAPLGTASDSGTTLNASFSAVWAPNHAYDPTYNQFKSIVPHAPPYDGELAAGLAQASFVNTGCVQASAFTPPSGVMISMILVPSATAPTGASFESATRGPIIPGTLQVDGDLLRAGAVIDAAFDSAYVKAAAFYPSSSTYYDGYGHAILNFAANTDFAGGAALPRGVYAFRVVIRDINGAGTSQTIHFTVQ